MHSEKTHVEQNEKEKKYGKKKNDDDKSDDRCHYARRVVGKPPGRVTRYRPGNRLAVSGDKFQLHRYRGRGIRAAAMAGERTRDNATRPTVSPGRTVSPAAASPGDPRVLITSGATALGSRSRRPVRIVSPSSLLLFFRYDHYYYDYYYCWWCCSHGLGPVRQHNTSRPVPQPPPRAQPPPARRHVFRRRRRITLARTRRHLRSAVIPLDDRHRRRHCRRHRR